MARHLVAGLAAITLQACSILNGGAFTLYRNSVLDSSMRIHVATFDAADGQAHPAKKVSRVKALASGLII
jgi:hypothetical protein